MYQPWSLLCVPSCMWRVFRCKVYLNVICYNVLLFLVVTVNVELKVGCASVKDDHLSPYDAERHGSSRSLRDIAKCQHTMWGNRTVELQQQHDAATPFHRNGVYNFDNSTRSRTIVGRIAFVDKPLLSVTVLEPMKVGGCKKYEHWDDAFVSTVSDSILQKKFSKCKIAINAGFFTPSNGACLGNIISSYRIVKMQGIQLANFGIRKDGVLVTGYIPDIDINSTNVPFKELISGVVWLVRNGTNFVNQSSFLECDENQKTGKMKTFIEVVSARTAIGHTKDGRLVVAQVEGHTHVSGVNLYEFADILISKGVINAINLDGGGSATFLVDGVLTNHPSDVCGDDKEYRCPRKVSTVICIHDPECAIPDCSGHGLCNDQYNCVCNDPWFGYGCHLVNCTLTNCSSHGNCSQDKCVCNDGWTGALCEKRCNPDRYGPNCQYYCSCGASGHGHCTAGTSGCVCDPGWTGWSCDKKCPEGKYGQGCAQSCMSSGCSGHGQCSYVNGSCLCDKDWMGIACNISMQKDTSSKAYCSWKVSSVENVTLACQVDFGQVFNKLSYNLTSNILNVSRNMTVIADNVSTACLERIHQSSKAPFIVLLIVVSLCVVITTINIFTCIKPDWLSNQMQKKFQRFTNYKQLKVKDENQL